MTHKLLSFGPAVRFAIIAVVVAACVAAADPQRGSVERIKVHGKSLEGNLEGDSPDRDVSVYLPPSYAASRARRYPVVYMLHGFTDDDARWMGLNKHWINLSTVLDKVFAAGAAREVIVVMPNGFTRYHGSMYSNSVTTGNWEEFIASELVAYIDSHYRTIATAASRGLAGHSMGGYGTLRIAMKRPDVFSSIYALSPCCLAPPDTQFARPNPRAEAIRSYDQLDKADFFTKATLASAAAWSPNPNNPPLFLDLLYRDGTFQPRVAAKWAANAPLAMVDQYISNLKKLRAIGFDSGDKDTGIAPTVKILDQILNDYKLPHAYEIYEGNHVNRIAERIETKVLPFFSTNLAFK